MKKISILTAAFVLLLATTAVAQDKQASTITVKVDGLVCSTSLGTGIFSAQGWSFGAFQSVDQGGSVGKASTSDLNVQKAFDECSPALFGATTSGRHFQTAILTQQVGKNIVMTVTMSSVLVSSYSIGGTESTRDPLESVSFNFAKICINNASSGKEACFDSKQIVN